MYLFNTKPNKYGNKLNNMNMNITTNINQTEYHKLHYNNKYLKTVTQEVEILTLI